ncbi:MAG: DUF4982 domain-containing protein [Alistipes sp.]|nr:DUF4982 domain-containing protein [Alistipes sp.]
MKFRLSTLILSAILFVTTATAQRVERSINEAWSFVREGDKTITVNIPHSWNVTDSTDDTPGYFRGKGEYQKRVVINDPLDGRSVYLYFEGANQVTQVWVNGNYIGKHIGGYSAFCFDISAAIQQGDNIIKVTVDNSHNADIAPLSADFTFFGGIYRDVNLIITPQAHISTTHYASSGVYVTTPQVSDSSAKVELRTMLTNNSHQKQVLYLHHKLVSPTGEVVKTLRSKVTLAPESQNAEHTISCDIVSPQLWSPDTPHLYTLYTSLCDKGGNELDCVSNAIGLRHFSLDPAKGFYINGKRFKLMGTNRHQDYALRANALSDALHISDIRTIKDMGSNFLRISHYPQDRIVTRMCDRLGLVTSVEIPIVNAITPSDAFLENSLEMIREMVYQDYNSPSVMIWAYMNEVLLRTPYLKSETDKRDIYYAHTYKHASAIDSLLRQLDPYRLTMIPCHKSEYKYRDSKLLTLPDIIGWNLYYGWYERDIEGFGEFLDQIHAKYPNQGQMVSEYGADMDIRLHSLQPERYDYTCEYGIYFHQYHLREILKRDFIVGANVWNYNDFHSEARNDGIPHINNKGLVDAAREKKDVYYLHKAAYTPAPYIKVGGEHWLNRGGVTVDGVARQRVSVFTNATSVELFHNGKSLGTAEVKDFTADFEVPFMDGANCIKAVAVKDGAQVSDSVTLPFKGYPSLITADFEELNVLLGTVRYFDDREDGIAWIPEKEYRPGSWGYIGGEPNRPAAADGKGSLPATMNIDFPNTTKDPLWQTQRKNMETFRADVPDGKYCVMLYFAEWESTAKKEEIVNILGGGAQASNRKAERVFDLSINDTKVLTAFDITAEVGAEQGIVKKFMVDATNGHGITIRLTPIHGEPTLCAVRIYRHF